MTDVTVYGFPQSTFVRTARMALEEKGVAYDLEPAAPSAPGHEDRHPFRRVPAFGHGEVRLFETAAIAVYVDEAFDGPPLQPGDARGRALMMQWISVVIDYIVHDVNRPYLLEYLIPSGPGGKPDMDKIGKALDKVRHHLGVFDRALGRSRYLAGDDVTLADLFLAPVVAYIAKMPEGAALLGACPDLARWFDAMAARASFKATIPPPVTADLRR